MCWKLKKSFHQKVETFRKELFDKSVFDCYKHISRSRNPNKRTDWDFLKDQRTERKPFIAGGIDETDKDFEAHKEIRKEKENKKRKK